MTEIKSGNYGLVPSKKDPKRIEKVQYYNNDGEALATSSYSPAEILRSSERLGLDISGLKGLGEQAKTAGLTGKYMDIDLNDLAMGGLGTKHDWTQDENVHLKGWGGQNALRQKQELAQRLGVGNYSEDFASRFGDGNYSPRPNVASGGAAPSAAQLAAHEAASGGAGGNRIDQALGYQLGDGAYVENRLNNLLAEDSAYVDRARARAAQGANRRGLLNSSIAMGAGEGAAIDAALPIASQDAATDAQLGFNKQGILGQVGQQEMDQDFRRSESALDRELQTSLQDDQQDFVSGQANLDRQQKTTLQQNEQAWRSGEAELDRNQQEWLQANEQEWRTTEAALDRELQKYGIDKNEDMLMYETVMKSAIEILADPNIKAKNKGDALNNLQSVIQNVSDFQAGLGGSFAGGTTVDPTLDEEGEQGAPVDWGSIISGLYGPDTVRDLMNGA